MPISRRRALGLAAVSAVATPARLAFAKDHFWDAKPAAEWSEKEVREVMTHSPWAKEVTAEFKGGGMGMRPPGGGGGGRGMGGGGGRGGMGGGMGGGSMDASAGPPMGGGGGPGGMGGGMGGGGGDMPPGMPQIKALVRWETASPVRQAGKRNWPPSAEQSYIVTVSGLPNMGGGGAGGGGGQKQGGGPPMDPEQRRKMMAERLKAATRLERKGKDPIGPDQVQMGQGPNGASILLFVFPKTGQPIQLGDKEVVFITQMGPMEVKAKFALKDMTVKGQLEL